MIMKNKKILSALLAVQIIAFSAILPFKIKAEEVDLDSDIMLINSNIENNEVLGTEGIKSITTSNVVEKNNENFTLKQGEVINKTFAYSGEYVDINGTINGNAFIAGTNVNIAGIINGDLYVVGNILNISGTIDGNLFVAGNTITISSLENVDNVYVVGNMINADISAKKNTYIIGNNTTINNITTGKDAFIIGNLLSLKAKIGRDANIQGTKVDADLNIERNAKILAESLSIKNGSVVNNDLEIYEDSLNNNITVNGEVFFKVKPTTTVNVNPVKTVIISKSIQLGFSLFSILVVGLIIIKIYSAKIINKVNEETKANFFSNFGKGLLAVLISSVVLIFCAILIVGIKISAFIACLIGAMIFIANIMASIFIGWGLLKATSKKEPSLYLALLLGGLIYSLISLIPVAGVLFKIIMIPTSIGALISSKKESLKKLQA